MKNTFLLLMLLLVSSTIFVGCDPDAGDDELKVDVLLPVKLGNNWTYRETHYHYYYGDEPEINVDTFSQQITGPYRINGVDYYSMDYTYQFEEPDYPRRFIGSDENGNMLSLGGFTTTDTLIFNSIYLKKNPTKGEVWATTDLGFNYSNNTLIEDSCTFTCISTDTVITTPKGSYHCTAWEAAYEEFEEILRIYMKVNIGIIKVESIESGRLRSVRELIDCTLH